MRVKLLPRLLLALLVALILIGSAFAGGITFSHHMLTRNDNNNEYSYNKDKENEKKDDNKENVNRAKDIVATPFPNERVEKKNNILNVLLLGVDKDGYRTDVIILAQYNFKTGQLNMLQIPRDTRIETTRIDKKINSVYAAGKEQELFKTVGRITGIIVDKYLLVNLQGFRSLVDEIGGVRMDVPINMHYNDPIQNLVINLKKGEQVLDGKKAEMFIRFRKNNDGTGYPDGDLGRMKAQQVFINSMTDKILSLNNIFKAPKLVSIVLNNVKTNFEASELPKYIGETMKIDRNNINMMSLPGEADYVKGISYFLYDKQKTKEVVKESFVLSEKGTSY